MHADNLKRRRLVGLSNTFGEAITQHTQGKVTPTIKIVDKGLPTLFSPNEEQTLNVDITQTMNFFEIKKLRNPKETIFEIVNKRITG